MNKIMITLIDVTTGEVFTETMEIYGWPALVEPYCAPSGRMGVVVRMEKLMIPVTM